MTEAEIEYLIKTMGNNEYEVDVFKRDFTGRMASQATTFMMQVSPGSEVEIVQNIQSREEYENGRWSITTELDIQQQSPVTYIFITAECTF